MNINIKNCKVHLITGTETMNISSLEETKDAGIIGMQRTYTLAGFLARKDEVNIGDRVKLPSFTVPEHVIAGDDDMKFDEIHINDEYAAVAGRDKNGLLLKFERILFNSAVDFNGETEFSKTQQGQYLGGAFKEAMNSAGIPADSCRLIFKEEMFGDSRLEFFKTGRNRIAFDKDEDFSIWCWLGTAYGVTGFCGVGSHGDAGYYSAAIVGAVSPALYIR